MCPSPNLFLAALSQRTSRMRIGALVNVLPTYDPLRLTEEIAVLDQLCAGRLDLGVGRGVSPYELAYFGVSDEDSRALFTETLDVVTTALATGRMVHRGERLRDYDVELSVRPVQQPHPPLWYASSNTNSAEWAGRTGINFVGLVERRLLHRRGGHVLERLGGRPTAARRDTAGRDGRDRLHRRHRH